VDSILSKMNPVHTHHISLRSILLLFYCLRIDIVGGVFPSGFPTRTLMHLSRVADVHSELSLSLSFFTPLTQMKALSPI
jgi:hypothetical protein